MKVNRFLAIIAVSALLPSFLAAARPLPSGTVLKPNIDLTGEKAYVNASIVLLENEILNNQEEEYILLATSDSYFPGFDDAMLDVINQLNGFNYTGDQSGDLAAIESNLLAAQNSADALGTPYGTGMGTAYQYAIVVLNRKFANSLGENSISKMTKVQPVEFKTAISANMPVSSRVRRPVSQRPAQ